MPIALSIEGDSTGDELRSMYDWLLREDGLRGAKFQLAAAGVREGTMGAVSDAIVVALGSGSAGAVLARSLSVWLSTRGSDIKMKVATPRGEVSVDARRVRDLPELFGEIENILDDLADEDA